MPFEVERRILGLMAALGMLGAVFVLSPLLRPRNAVGARREQPTNTLPIRAQAGMDDQPEKGHGLFDHNSAHCHGEDARGDEGPDLHGLAKSNARISAIIKGGIKGEMPSFAKKFADAEVRSLIAYLRTLKD